MQNQLPISRPSPDPSMPLTPICNPLTTASFTSRKGTLLSTFYDRLKLKAWHSGEVDYKHRQADRQTDRRQTSRWLVGTVLSLPHRKTVYCQSKHLRDLLLLLCSSFVWCCCGILVHLFLLLCLLYLLLLSFFSDCLLLLFMCLLLLFQS